MNTKSLYLLSKFELVEMVRDFYRDDRERTKYLNSRTKQQLIKMLEERLMYPPLPPPRTIYPPTPYNSPCAMTDTYIQSKYGTFLKQLNEKPEEETTTKSK